MTNVYISDFLRNQVKQRANDRCEYCRQPSMIATQTFHIDHVIAVKHRGKTILENLAWACFSCNLDKGSDLCSYDEATGMLTALFNPRSQAWADHFELDQDGMLSGKTPMGRITIYLLHLNAPERVESRYILNLAGLW